MNLPNPPSTGPAFYTQSRLGADDFQRKDILVGKVVRINPALITLTDGLIGKVPVEELRARVKAQVRRLFATPVHTVHVDLNFPDYGGFSAVKPDLNAMVFSPAFVRELSEEVRSAGRHLNLHFLTTSPLEKLQEYAGACPEAVCYQLEVLPDAAALEALTDAILELGACASPVIETVGSDRHIAPPFETALARLAPVLDRTGLVTLQAAGTGSRTNQTAGALAIDAVRSAIQAVRTVFSGPLQIQGGVTLETVATVVGLGAEFLVCGTQLFHPPEGLSTETVIERMLEECAKVLE